MRATSTPVFGPKLSRRSSICLTISSNSDFLHKSRRGQSKSLGEVGGLSSPIPLNLGDISFKVSQEKLTLPLDLEDSNRLSTSPKQPKHGQRGVLARDRETGSKAGSFLESSTLPDEVILEDNSLTNEMVEILSQIRKEARVKLCYSQAFLFGNLMANILGLLMSLQIISLFIVLGIIIGFITLLFILRLRKKHENIKERFFEMAHIMSICLFVLMTIFRMKSIVETMLPGFIPGCAITVLESCLFRPRSIKSPELKWLLWIQLALLSFKLDHFQIEWPLVLILLNFFIILVFLISIVALLLWVLTLLGGTYFQMTGKHAVIGSTWNLLLLLTMLSWGIEAVFIQDIIPYSLVSQKMWYFFAVNAGYCLLLFSLSVFFHKQLMWFLKEQVFKEKIHGKDARQFEYKKVFKLVETDRADFVKLSSTYYREVRAHETSLTCRGDFPCNASNIPEIYKDCNKKYKVRIKLVDSKSAKDFKLHTRGEYDVFLNTQKQDRMKSLSDSRRRVVKEETNDCLICYENNAEIVIMDCGHGGLCSVCAVKRWRESKKCHICRGNVVSLLKLKYQPEKRSFQTTHKIVLTEQKRQVVLLL